MKKEIADIERKASQNINEDKTKVEFEEKDLEGLPKDTLEKLEKVPEKEGFRYVSMKYPEVIPALRLCKNEETRKKLDFVRSSQCQDLNVPLLEELVQKRHELAMVLGFSSISEYILSVRMAKTPKIVQTFEEELTAKLAPKGKEELARLTELKKTETGNADATFNTWDYSFYDNLLKENFYKVDEEKIKEYFPMDQVTKSTFDIYQELFGLIFEKIENA